MVLYKTLFSRLCSQIGTRFREGLLKLNKKTVCGNKLILFRSERIKYPPRLNVGGIN